MMRARVAGFANPLRLVALKTLTKQRAVALLSIIHKNAMSTDGRDAVLARLEHLDRSFKLDQIKYIGCSPDKRTNGDSPWSIWAPVLCESTYEHITRRRPPSSTFMDEGVCKVRRADAQHAALRRVQGEAEMSMQMMPAVIAGTQHGLADVEEPPNRSYMTSKRALNVRHDRPLCKDNLLQRKEVEDWMTSNPVVRSSSTTDCTFVDGETFAQHDAFAPKGDYKDRSPRTIFIGIGPVAGKSPTLCATESFCRTLAVLGCIFLAARGSARLDHVALSEVKKKHERASSSHEEADVHVGDLLDPRTGIMPTVNVVAGVPVSMTNVHTEKMEVGEVVDRDNGPSLPIRPPGVYIFCIVGIHGFCAQSCRADIFVL